MAIWQYRGEFVPELWLIAKYGRIPIVLEGYLATEGDIDLNDVDNPHWWRDISIPGDIAQWVNAILPQRESWSEDALMFGNEESSDFTIWYENAAVDAISFRWDLREPNIDLLNRIVRLAKELGAYVVSGDRATIIKPDFQAVLSDIKESDAYSFCKNPRRFISELGRKLDD